MVQTWGAKNCPKDKDPNISEALSICDPASQPFLSLNIFFENLFSLGALVSVMGSRFPLWGPGFTKGQVDVRSASGLFDARGA